MDDQLFIILSETHQKNQEGRGNWVDQWDTLGDSVLVEVVAALAHGYILEGAANSSLRVGYSPKFVATAIYLVSLGSFLVFYSVLINFHLD